MEPLFVLFLVAALLIAINEMVRYLPTLKRKRIFAKLKSEPQRTFAYQLMLDETRQYRLGFMKKKTAKQTFEEMPFVADNWIVIMCDFEATSHLSLAREFGNPNYSLNNVHMWNRRIQQWYNSSMKSPERDRIIENVLNASGFPKEATMRSIVILLIHMVQKSEEGIEGAVQFRLAKIVVANRRREASPGSVADRVISEDCTTPVLLLCNNAYYLLIGGEIVHVDPETGLEPLGTGLALMVAARYLWKKEPTDPETDSFWSLIARMIWTFDPVEGVDPYVEGIYKTIKTCETPPEPRVIYRDGREFAVAV